MNPCFFPIFERKSDYAIRKRCRDREDFYREKAYTKAKAKEQADQIAAKDSTIKEQDATIKKLADEINSLKKLLKQHNIEV